LTLTIIVQELTIIGNKRENFTMKKLLALLGTITLGTSTFMADTSTITTAKTVIENNIFDEEGLN
jgi:hypothetical protein